MTTLEIMKKAKAASPLIARADRAKKDSALLFMADELCGSADKILKANEADLADAKGQISDIMLDRLALSTERIEAMAQGVREVAQLPDPVGSVINELVRPNGLKIKKVSVPLGVVAIIYENRPNVTSDAAALCLKSGNACVLRSGKLAWRSANEITAALKAGLEKAGLPRELIGLVEDTSRQSSIELMTGVGYIDLLIPRGGAGLIKACVENAKVPCIETGTGICHIYVDETADIETALNIVDNAKTNRPSVCNAMEVLLVNEKIAPLFLPQLKKRLCEERAAAGKKPVELRLSTAAAAIIDGKAASKADFDTEFLDYIMALELVPDVTAAVKHISAHSTGHSEAIVTRSEENAKAFAAGVDSAAVYINASTRFTDGGVFGLGCEMGISTQKLHARGPMGLCELNSYKYVIEGTGQVR